jgi:hypothetical protein
MPKEICRLDLGKNKSRQPRKLKSFLKASDFPVNPNNGNSQHNAKKLFKYFESTARDALLETFGVYFHKLQIRCLQFVTAV